MSTMMEAFKKSGIGNDILTKIDKEKEEAELQARREREEKQKEEIKAMQERRLKEKEYDLFVSYVDLIKSRPKGNDFLYHIVCSYTPFYKSYKVMVKKDEHDKMECCFCKTEIMPIFEVMEKMPKVIMDSVLNMDEAEDRHKRYTEVLQGRRVGYSAEGTNTNICFPCFEQFVEWITRNVLYGDSLINSALRKMRKGIVLKD